MVRAYTRRRFGAPVNPSVEGRDLLTPRIERLRYALLDKVGVGTKAGVSITDEDIAKADKASDVTFTEHIAYQDTQAWAHASGLISYQEAQIIYQALGEVGSESNGGWAEGTDTATKVTVTKVIGELLGMKIKQKRGY